MFLFKFFNNILGINTRLSHFVPNHSRGCTFCTLNGTIPIPDETFLHIFFECGTVKEVIKEQPTPANLSATARRVLRCTRSQKPSCSFNERIFGYFHRTVPKTPSQIGFLSVKQKIKITLWGTLKWIVFHTGVQSSNCPILRY